MGAAVIGSRSIHILRTKGRSLQETVFVEEVGKRSYHEKKEQSQE